MKNTLFSCLTFIVLSLPGILFAQYKMVEYDHLNAYFNNGQPLPSESNLIVTGAVNNTVSYVEIAVFKEKVIQTKTPLYHSSWSAFNSDGSGKFRIPFSYKLKGSSSYDFAISYYKSVSQKDKQQLISQISKKMEIYLQEIHQEKNEMIEFTKSDRKILNDLNSIAVQALKDIKTIGSEEFPGFSDLVKTSLNDLQEGKNSKLASLEYFLRSEVEAYIDQELIKLIETREILSYETEKSKSALALNLGYGGVYFSGGAEDISYGTSPYVGISLPLGNRAFAGRFLSNTSISIGAFTRNFEDQDGNAITGPIFGRPYFAGIGYNVIRFVKINAGATLVENSGSSGIGGGTASIDVGAISVKPFVGISAEIDLWLGLREKR